ncbi:NUDIX domain-containing protein [Streptomyces sp. NPDC039022]|uniref:NUDIX domain-containing protein n=1 Tax=unclassified Streptomyces TaxID=2593676 RepID=UPI0033FED944
MTERAVDGRPAPAPAGHPRAAGKLVVGALIVDSRDRVFLQQRSADRRLFPGCWDLVGGHVEPDESPLEALARELTEETGWRLGRVLHRVAEGQWDADDGTRTETDYLVEAVGDLTAPRLERDKHPRCAWVGPHDLALLDDSVRRSGSTFVRDAVTAAHTWLARTPASHRKDISDTL